MMTKRKRKPRSEDGFAVLELVVAIPLLVTVLAGICDLSIWIRSFMLSNEAATAAASSFMHADTAPDAASLKKNVLAACPDIEACDAKLAVTTRRQASPTTTTFSHATESEGTVTGAVDKTMVRVTCTIRRGWASFIGPALSAAVGLGGDCVAASSRTFEVETVAESGWSGDEADW